MKKVVCISLIISFVLLCFSGCARGMGRGEENYTSYAGVYVTLESFDESMISLRWHNDSDSYITFGLGYTVEFLDGDEWKSVQTTDFAIPEIACTIEAGADGVQNYSLKHFCTLRPGTYRICTEFYVPERDIGTQFTYATFKVFYTL